MAERGIIFSAPMVCALLDGRKTQTRRLCRLDKDGDPVVGPHRKGDRLYVRETCAIVGSIDPGWVLYRASGYKAECKRHGFDNPPREIHVRWRPSIHMPRWASRMTLTVTDVRLQRLRDISESDARAEGLKSVSKDGETFKWGIADRDGLPGNDDQGWHWADWRLTARNAFGDLWNSLHHKPGTRWEDNPWIYALTFHVEHANIDSLPSSQGREKGPAR